MPDMEWESHKAEIERLYLHEGRTLESVRQVLSSNRGFSASKKQYERKIQQWGNQKYKMNPEKWKYINRRIQKRKRRDGKESEVYIAGSRCPPEKIQEGIARHGFVSTAEMHTAPSPKTPEDITVFTPAQLPSIESEDEPTRALLPNKANTDTETGLEVAHSRPQIPRAAGSIGLTAVARPFGGFKNIVGGGSVTLPGFRGIIPTPQLPKIVDAHSDRKRPSVNGQIDAPGLPRLLDWMSESIPWLSEITPQQRSRTVLQSLLRSAHWTEEKVPCALDPNVTYGLPKILRDFMGSPMINLKVSLFDAIKILPGARIEDLVWILVHCAVINQDPAMVRSLLSAGFHPERSPRGRCIVSSLQIAVEGGQMEIVNLLLFAGVDVNYQSILHLRPTALQMAVKMGNVDMMEMLLRAGANVNSLPAPEKGATALQYAAMNGHIEIARRLLEARADVNAGRAIFYGRAALEAAAERGNIDMLDLFLRSGLRVDGDFRTQYIRAVLFAERNRHWNASKMLKSYGQWTESDEMRLGEVDVERDIVSSPLDFLDMMAS